MNLTITLTNMFYIFYKHNFLLGFLLNQPERMENATILIVKNPMDTEKIKMGGSRVKLEDISQLGEKMKDKVDLNCAGSRVKLEDISQLGEKMKDKVILQKLLFLLQMEEILRLCMVLQMMVKVVREEKGQVEEKEEVNERVE